MLPTYDRKGVAGRHCYMLVGHRRGSADHDGGVCGRFWRNQFLHCANDMPCEYTRSTSSMPH